MDIAFDDEDKMYVINTSYRVQIIGHINSSFQNHIYMQDEQPIRKDSEDICVNGDNMYITEKGDLNVPVFSIDGQVVSQKGKGHIQSPCGIAVDLVCVCDWEKEYVLVF